MLQRGSTGPPSRPLSPDERALLFYYCLNHAVARCLGCARSYYLSELVADLLSGRTHLCPPCRRDLTENVRSHVYGCTVMPEEVRQGRRPYARRRSGWGRRANSCETRRTS